MIRCWCFTPWNDRAWVLIAAWFDKLPPRLPDGWHCANDHFVYL